MITISSLTMYGLNSLLYTSSNTSQPISTPPQEVVIRIVYENKPNHDTSDGQELNTIQSVLIQQDDTTVLAPIFKHVLAN